MDARISQECMPYINRASQETIPLELMTQIFEFMSRPERLVCAGVCRKWKEALDRKYLWQKFVISIDRDFLDPSTIYFVNEYHRHIESLEFGWEKPQMQNRWLPLKVQDLTKRVVHLMFILHDKSVQISSLRVFEWYDSYPFKKIIYHFARFLKIQKKLKKLIFHNINLPKPECIKILNACLGSKETISYLEIHNYFYNFNTAFDTNEFIDNLQQFAYLRELKLDYFIFSRPRVIDIVAENGRRFLNSLEIYFDEIDLHSIIIPDKKWRKLNRLCPDLKISFCIRNICHLEQIGFIFLMEHVPLTSFSLITSSKFDQKISRNFEGTLTELIRLFHNTLEVVNLDLKNNKENLDSLLFNIILKCPNLKNLLFDGMVGEDMYLFHQICQYRKGANGLHVKILPLRYKSFTNIIHLLS